MLPDYKHGLSLPYHNNYPLVTHNNDYLPNIIRSQLSPLTPAATVVSLCIISPQLSLFPQNMIHLPYIKQSQSSLLHQIIIDIFLVQNQSLLHEITIVIITEQGYQSYLSCTNHHSYLHYSNTSQLSPMHKTTTFSWKSASH